jgi:hypothetical protein
MLSNRDSVVRAELLRIASLNNGQLDVDTIIEEAKNPENPLHVEYEWDIEKAAYDHWRQTTRSLLNRFKIYDDAGTKRGLVHVRAEINDIPSSYYRTFQTVTKDELSRGCRAQLIHAIGTLGTVLEWIDKMPEKKKECSVLQRTIKNLRSIVDTI